jgi:hypothetical protein
MVHTIIVIRGVKALAENADRLATAGSACRDQRSASLTRPIYEWRDLNVATGSESSLLARTTPRCKYQRQ